MMMRYFTLTLLTLLSCAALNPAQANETQFKGLNIIMAQSAPASDTSPVTIESAPELQTEIAPSSAIVPVPTIETSDAAHKNEAHGSSGLPQFNPASWASQIFWLTIIFGTFYALSSFWIVPKMGSIVTARADYISDNLKQAETLSNEAHHIKHDYETDLKTSHIKANETIQSIHEQSKARLNASVTEFRQTYERDIAATESMIKKAQDDAMVDMNKIVATVASSAAEKIAGITTDKAQAENVVKLLNDKKAKAA